MLRVLIVGTGSIGERHLRCFQNTHRVEVAFCEPLEQRRKDVQDRYQVRSAYVTLDDALQSSFDAAVICTPAPFHIPQALQLAARGIHLLIEKPLSTSLDGIDELQRIVQSSGLVAGVAYVLRTHPTIVAMRDALQSGRFGAPVQIVACSGQHFPTYRPAYREIYYNRRETGGGAIQDAITHMLNAGEFLLGPIDRLQADAAHQLLPGVSVEDTVHVIVRQGNVLGTYCLNQYQAPNESTITIVCERGTLRLEFHRGRWSWMVDPSGVWTEEPAFSGERDALFEIQAHVFLDALEGKCPPACSLAEGLQTLRVNLAILNASASPAWTTP